MDIDYSSIKWRVVGIHPGLVRMGVCTVMIDRNKDGWDKIKCIKDWEVINLVDSNASKKTINGMKPESLVAKFSDYIRNHLIKSIEMIHCDAQLKIAYVIETKSYNEKQNWMGSLIMYNTLRECIRWISATLVPGLHNRIFVRLNPSTETLKTPVTDSASNFADLYKSSDAVFKCLTKKIQSFENIVEKKTSKLRNKSLTVLLTMSLLANKMKLDQMTKDENGWKKWCDYFKDLLMMTQKDHKDQERAASDSLFHACSFAFLEIIKMPDYIKLESTNDAPASDESTMDKKTIKKKKNASKKLKQKVKRMKK